MPPWPNPSVLFLTNGTFLKNPGVRSCSGFMNYI